METKQIYAAFVKAQKGFAPALKTSTNPHFKSRYADLAACVEAVIDSLNENGIGLVQKTHEDDKGVKVETVFVHESGECMSGGVLHVPAAKHDPQGFGSALSYARRYSLMAACGIAPEDDDGNEATKGVQKAAETAKEPTPKDRADLLKKGVARGDAVNAAAAIAGWPPELQDAVWKFLDKETAEALDKSWPRTPE